MPSFYFFLGFTILGTVCLQWANSAQPDVETNLDFASIPGHLEELGAKNTKRSVEVIQSFPDPETFFRTYVDGSKPVLIQNGAKMSSAVEKWTDEYFLVASRIERAQNPGGTKKEGEENSSSRGNVL